jgi:hypothetical protein
MKLATSFTLLLVACGTSESSDPGGPVLVQSQFDLTAVTDRAFFAEQDLAFVETLGPYAMFEVTGPEPALLGPRVEFWDTEDGGFAMLCGAHGYFAYGAAETGVQAHLLGGSHGDEPIVSFRQATIQQDGCTGPREDTAVRMPDDGDDGELETEEIGDDPDALLGEAGDELVERLVVSFDPAPGLGSLVLLQRVALSGQRPPSHARSHSIPDVCCEGKECLLR